VAVVEAAEARAALLLEATPRLLRLAAALPVRLHRLQAVEQAEPVGEARAQPPVAAQVRPRAEARLLPEAADAAAACN
jgi:hypothetical protein